MTRKEVIEILSRGDSLAGANLMGIDLSGIDLSYTDMTGSNLTSANLQGANLRGAVLQDASLVGANLVGANLEGANLQNADLYYANLDNTNLTEAKGPLMEYRRGKVVTEPLIGYKKCQDGVIVTLEIPKGATVFSINGYKCRTNKVRVVAIDGADKGISHYNYMSYYVGDVITINDFDCDYSRECANGIHFFMNREDAENYIF